MINVAIVDDHELFRKSVALLLTTFHDIQAVYDSDDGNDFIKKATTTDYDVLLLDLQMPKMDGFEVCKMVKKINPEIKILIVTQLSTKEVIHHIMDCGANGFFSKSSSPKLLELAINSVVEKDYYFDMELSTVIREAILWNKKNETQKKLIEENPLTPREVEIIQLVSKEMSSREIADLLCISYRTVEKHRKAIMEKTYSKNFVGVILFALKHNLISLMY